MLNIGRMRAEMGALNLQWAEMAGDVRERPIKGKAGIPLDH